MKFTIDPDRAVQLLGRLQLPSPDYYLLKLVQAGVASGAPRIDVAVDFFKVDVRFVPPEPLDTNHLFRHLVAPGERALRHLAVGINSAPQAVDLEQGAVRQVFSAKGSWEERCPASQGLRLRVRRFGFPRAPELELLRAHCRWSPVPVFVNGADLGSSAWGAPRPGTSGHHLVETYLFGADGLRAPGSSHATAPPRLPAGALAGSIRCRAVLALLASQGSRVDLVQDGVVVARRPLKCPGLLAVLDAGELATDLSGFEVVENERYAQLLEELPEHWRSLRERSSRA